MAAPAGKGGATARALRAESRTPPSDLMEGPGLPRRGGAHSDTGPGGAGWRGWAGRWLRSSAAPVPLNTPRPTWRTLNLDWPPLSANPSATAIPTLHRARRGHGAARGERAPRGHGGAGARRAPSGRNGSRNAAGIGAAAGSGGAAGSKAGL
ncbi:collagen alpha-2(I) chain-like [Pseudopipra pipra]|uniref:collagen alpha-2(I) chain-like n=1 Tax=Pseudopipra pipra TaxID=415032 RepID=UPI0031394E4F